MSKLYSIIDVYSGLIDDSQSFAKAVLDERYEIEEAAQIMAASNLAELSSRQVFSLLVDINKSNTRPRSSETMTQCAKRIVRSHVTSEARKYISQEMEAIRDEEFDDYMETIINDEYDEYDEYSELLWNGEW